MRKISLFIAMSLDGYIADSNGMEDVILGKGIRLFGDMEKEIKLKLCKTQSYNGITDLVYVRRED